MNPVVSQLVAHDLDDTEALLDLVATLPDDVLRAPRRCGGTVTEWEGSEESIRDVLEHHVYTKEVWLAAIDGADDVPALLELLRADELASRALEQTRPHAGPAHCAGKSGCATA